MRAMKILTGLAVLSALMPAQHAIGQTVIIPAPYGGAPDAAIFGPRYGAPDLPGRDERFNPYAPAEDGVSRYADPQFLERNVAPYRPDRRRNDEKRWIIEERDLLPATPPRYGD